PHERESYLAAMKLLENRGVPLVAAIEEYVRAREIGGDVSLTAVATDYARHFGGVVPRKVPDVVAELMTVREQDGASKAYLGQLRTTLNRFADQFPNQITTVTAADIDGWLRGLGIAPGTRNSMLRCIKVLFSFAKNRSYLPADRSTEAEKVALVKVKRDDPAIFTPDQFSKLLDAAEPDLIPILAIGGFAGIRMAELDRLDWTAVDLDRRIIEIRAGQAKTASRRIVPITDNLATWLEPLPRTGKVVRTNKLHRKVSALAKECGLEWPRNVLRHSFITYRIAAVQSAEQVALEAGNSPDVIFKHYRELVTEDQAGEWFGIRPGQQ
ncbi:MAG: tyrosine-type recombinase/integrase, partial [Planctomycetota bacterium]